MSASNGKSTSLFFSSFFSLFHCCVELQLMYLLNNYFLYVNFPSINCSFQLFENEGKKFPSHLKPSICKGKVLSSTSRISENLICKHISISSSSFFQGEKVAKAIELRRCLCRWEMEVGGEIKADKTELKWKLENFLLYLSPSMLKVLRMRYEKVQVFCVFVVQFCHHYVCLLTHTHRQTDS